ncbi:MAG: methyltransferase domain-containing protein, partial [Pseudonocardiaceae bacterium]
LKPQTSVFRGWKHFVVHGYRSFQRTGALAPSSRWLARKLAQPIRDSRVGGAKLNVLEAGAGNGAASNYIAQLLRPGDSYTLVEVNDAFTTGLREWIDSEEIARLRLADVKLIEDTIAAVPAHGQFDVILSGLPHKNFGLPGATETFDWYFRALRPGGVLAFIRLAHLPQGNVDKMISEQYRLYGTRRAYVPLNIPPAWVCYLQKP